MTTPILQIVEINPTTQERSIFNAGLRHIEAYLGLLTGFQVNTPPASPPAGYKAIVGTTPTGVWEGFANHVVVFVNGTWIFIPPNPLLSPQSLASGTSYVWDGTAWVVFSSGGAGGLTIQELDGTPSSAIVQLVVPNGSLSVASGVGTLLFDVGLTSDRTYFIRLDGSDSNNGLTNSAGGAFATISRFFSEVATLKLNGFTVFGQLGDGIHLAPTTNGIEVLPGVGSGNVVLQGNASNNTLVTIRNTVDQSGWTIGGIIANLRPSATIFTVQNLTFSNTASTGSATALFARYGALLQHSNINFGNFVIPGGTTNHISATDEAIVRGLTSYNISGGATRHWNVTGGANLRHNNSTITLSNSPAFTTFALATNKALMSVQGNTFAGTPATGQRFSVNNLSEIFAAGGPTYLPGSTGGTADAATFGLYL